MGAYVDAQQIPILIGFLNDATYYFKAENDYFLCFRKIRFLR